MFARIGTWQGSADEVERWIARGREYVKPSIQQDPGLSAAYCARRSARRQGDDRHALGERGGDARERRIEIEAPGRPPSATKWSMH